MTRMTLFALWFVILIIGIGVYTFFPNTFEPLLCQEGERIAVITKDIDTSDSRDATGTDLACINTTGDPRFVGESVAIPFALIMTLIAFALASKRFDKFLGIKETPETVANSDEADFD